MRRSSLIATVLAVAAIAFPVAAIPPEAGGAVASDNVELVATFPDVPAVGGRIVDDTLYMTTWGGLRIFDLSLADGIPVPIGALELPHFENEDVDTNGETLLIGADFLFGEPTSAVFVIDVSIPQAPIVTGVVPVPDAHTASCIDDCNYAWAAGSNEVYVIDLRTKFDPRLVGSFRVPGGGTHDVNVDETGVAWLVGGGGVWPYRTSGLGASPVNPVRLGGPGNFSNSFIIHNTLRPDAAEASASDLGNNRIDEGELLLVTEEDWLAAGNGFCQYDGRFQTGWIRSSGGGGLSMSFLDSFRIGSGTLPDAKPLGVVSCSSHWFDTLTDEDVAAVAWYEQGVRFLDYSNPRDIRQIGYYMPAVSEAWQTLVRGDYIYVMDVARGLEVLSFSGNAGDATALAPHYGIAPAVGAKRHTVAHTH